LWNFCEGYNDEFVPLLPLPLPLPLELAQELTPRRGITHCSKPKNLYWFNPVQIILGELLYGATIALPSQITTILTLIHIVSNVMFGFFMLGICINFLLIFLSPLVLLSRWYSYHFVTFAFISALLTFAGSTTATVMYVIFQRVITSQKELSIGAKIGGQMFAFMWLSRKKHHDTRKDRREREKKEGKRRCPQVPKFWKRRVTV
jgi:hypothetical protein